MTGPVIGAVTGVFDGVGPESGTHRGVLPRFDTIALSKADVDCLASAAFPDRLCGCKQALNAHFDSARRRLENKA